MFYDDGSETVERVARQSSKVFKVRFDEALSSLIS